jgi:integrase
MPRRAKGEGPLKQRTDGRYETRLMVTDKLGRTKPKYFYGKTKAEAIKKRTDYKRGIERGAPVDPSKQLLSEYLAEWLNPESGDLRNHVRPHIVTDYARHVDRHIAPKLGHIPLSKVETSHVQSMIDELSEGGLAPNSVTAIKSVLQSALSDAKRRGLVGQNACTGARVPSRKPVEMKYWRPEQTRAFLTAAQGHPNEAYFVLAVTLGPRIGELLGLRWHDIDLDKGTLRIDRQLLQKRQNGQPVFGEVKSGSGRRTVRLTKLAIAALRVHRSRQAKLRLPVPEDLVFQDEDGEPYYQSRIARHFELLTEKAGLPRIRVHDMRHTAATLMILTGVNIKIVSETLGHSSITVTLDLYGHLIDEQRQQVADAMDRLLGG